jgi:hypothetical protein
LRLQQTEGNRAVQRLLQRAADAAAPAPQTDEEDLAARLRTAGGGRALEPEARQRLEQGLGADLSGVRVHTDGAADQMARAVDAVAFTTGPDVFFRAGTYAPGTPDGMRLLAHEATHTVQQAAGPVAGVPDGRGIAVSDPDDAFERAARAAGDSVSRVAPAETPASPGGLTGETSAAESADGGVALQRFGSEEHRQIGAEASGGATTDLDLGDGTTLTYGEMVALAGDFFGSLEEMRTLATTPDGQEQLRWARWNALHSGGEPSVSAAAKAAVLDRYYRLAANNWSHFSAGGTAASEYEGGHRDALSLAFFAGASGDEAKFAQATTAEAFCNHFLTDMFAGGHVRTPRQEMKEWYQANYPDSLGQFVSYTAGRITTNLDAQGDIPWYWPNSSVMEKLRGRIVALGGSAMESFTLGDIVALAYHHQDNAGLGVVSDVGPDGAPVAGGFRWTAMGDSHLADSPITRQMVEGAVRASLNDLTLAREAGLQASGGTCVPEEQLAGARDQAVAALQPFAALGFVPREDTEAGNTVMDWHWGQIDPTLRAAIDESVRNDIANTLRGKAGAVPEEIRCTRTGSEDPEGAVRLRVRPAFLQFCDQLAGEGVAALEAAMATAASPPTDAVLDGGVPLPAGVPDDSSDTGGGEGMDAGVPQPAGAH